MLKNHSLIFLVTAAVSVIAGFYGLFSGRLVIFFPYALINPLALFAASALVSDLQRRHQFELFSSLILLANLPGSVFFHGLGIQYDVPLHFLVSFFSFEALTLILTQKIKLGTALTIAFVATVIGGVGFEGFQKLSDLVFKTQLFFDVRQPALLDSFIDIVMNTAGAVTGLVFAKLTKISATKPTSQS